jgi:hypothetical protein
MEKLAQGFSLADIAKSDQHIKCFVGLMHTFQEEVKRQRNDMFGSAEGGYRIDKSVQAMFERRGEPVQLLPAFRAPDPADGPGARTSLSALAQIVEDSETHNQMKRREANEIEGKHNAPAVEMLRQAHFARETSKPQDHHSDFNHMNLHYRTNAKTARPIVNLKIKQVAAWL